ncbi:hypothetical protein IWQ57_000198 [Coemansia nantahalensis]|uniref:Uncharacterized protein n=1 Tax=Coemansia nantahalensis TaxID=2789366 RepID=A0ACC1K910_9FUNG|nr:hypothetical protein IWQ57_000198 [Coemansia nantahalensis]
MRRSRDAHTALCKPFKSPARATTAAAAAATAAGEAEPAAAPVTPTRPSAKRAVVPGSAPPPLRRVVAGRTPQAKRTRVEPQSAPATKRPKLAAGDPEIQRLVREQTALQRQAAQIRQEAALVERCLALQKKSDKQVVDALVAKWQIACARACDDLFELLKPAMEAQREAARLGFAPQGWSDDAPAADRPATPQRGGSADEQPESPAAHVHDSGGGEEEEEIDIAYMLKRFGIDPDLF